MKALGRLKFFYLLFRSFGNGRVRSLQKAIGLQLGRKEFIAPGRAVTFDAKAGGSVPQYNRQFRRRLERQTRRNKICIPA